MWSRKWVCLTCLPGECSSPYRIIQVVASTVKCTIWRFNTTLWRCGTTNPIWYLLWIGWAGYQIAAKIYKNSMFQYYINICFNFSFFSDSMKDFKYFLIWNDTKCWTYKNSIKSGIFWFISNIHSSRVRVENRKVSVKLVNEK